MHAILIDELAKRIKEKYHTELNFEINKTISYSSLSIYSGHVYLTIKIDHGIITLTDNINRLIYMVAEFENPKFNPKKVLKILLRLVSIFMRVIRGYHVYRVTAQNLKYSIKP